MVMDLIPYSVLILFIIIINYKKIKKCNADINTKMTNSKEFLYYWDKNIEKLVS